MIAGIFHEGSGLGDQLFRYVTVRTLAQKKGLEFGMVGGFKGFEFMNLEYGNSEAWNQYGLATFNEKVVRDEYGIDVRSYDPEINFVEDNTIIDGSFEDDKYWRDNLDNIDKWLAVDRLYPADDLCVIGFRGGEYYADHELGLPVEYYKEAIEKMLAINPAMQFQVHTDDPNLARQFFPSFEIVDNQRISHSKHTNMGFNWRSMRFAKYAIIPNSAFFIMPRILQHHENNDWAHKTNPITIAPRYWARRNKKVWARPACYYKEFTYI